MNPNQNSGFTEVGGISRGLPFDPRATDKNQMYYQEGNPANMLDGYLILMKQVPKKNEPGRFTTIWKIQKVNPDSSLGDIYDVIGDQVLNDRLGQMPLGTYIRLLYQGRKHKQNCSGPFTQSNSYHAWFTGRNDNVIPHAQVKAQYGEKFSPAYLQAMAGNNQQNQGQPQFSQPGAQQYGQPQQGQQQQGQWGQQQQQFGQQQGQPQWGQQGAGTANVPFGQPGQFGQPQQGQQFQQPPAQFGQPAQGQGFPAQAGQAPFNGQPQQFNQNFQQAPAAGQPAQQPFNAAGAQQSAPAQGQQFGQPAPGQGQPAPQNGAPAPFKQDLPF